MTDKDQILAHTDRVKALFDRTDVYLQRNSSIPVRVRLIRRMTAGIDFSDFIEVGCGDGTISLSLLGKSRRLDLLDLSENMLALARAKTPPEAKDNVRYIAGDIESVSAGKTYDLVICVGVLAHVPSVQNTINTIAKLTKPGGHVIIQFTEAASLFGWLNHCLRPSAPGGYQVNRTYWKTLRTLLTKAQLTVTRRRLYSDSGFGLDRLSESLACKLKIATSLCPLPRFFSENIVLLRKQAESHAQPPAITP